MSAAVLQVSHVSIWHARTSEPVVRDVSFAASPGALTAIVGPNGSGKSSLVRAMLGLAHRVTGDITIDGESLLRASPRARARALAVLAQRESLAFPMRVRDYVALGRAPHLALFERASAADAAAVTRALVTAEVETFADRRTDTLSGGEWQRVRLARVLAQDAPVVVLDEPTTFLDIAHEMATFEVLSALARAGRTVVLVSHTLALVARFADAIMLLHHGTLVASGTPREVISASTLESVYGWPLVVSHDPAVGAPTLVPLRRQR
jgi:iron complex transport system ATP-binding protein